jgi:predicted Rossmann-fold nucleotide-binding protein
MDKCISVFGSGTAREKSPVYQDAYQLGMILGKAGFSHVCGGYKGAMEEALKLIVNLLDLEI